MPIFSSDGKEYESEGHLMLGSPTEPVQASEESSGTQVPNSKNNASASSVEAPRGLPKVYITGQDPKDVEAQSNAQFIPGFDQGSWTDTLKNVWDNISAMKDIRASDIIKGAAESVKNAVTLPGDVLSGKVQPGSRQEVERAMDLAGLMVMGPAPVASKMADGTLGSFAGVRSQTMNRVNLQKANQMFADGIHPDDIWQDTGMFRGADGRWRYEIPDDTSALRIDAFKENIAPNEMDWSRAGGKDTIEIQPKPTPYPGIGDIEKMTPDQFEKSIEGWIKNQNSLPLSNVLHHPDLYAAYPFLKDIRVANLPEKWVKEGATGMFDGQTLYLGKMPSDEMHRTILHEVQHAIQRYEGFAGGGNKSQFLPEAYKQARKEFEEVRKTAFEQFIQKGLTPGRIKNLSIAVGHEMDGLDNLSSYGKKQVAKDIEEAKELGIYNHLKNIVKSERIINIAESEAFENYRRLAGEVESRNVELRMNYNAGDRFLLPPTRTEDVPRFMQDVREREPSASMSQKEPTQIRRSANDNFKPLDTKALDDVLSKELSGFKDLVDKENYLWKKLDEAKEMAAQNKYDDLSMARINKILEELNNL